jgi:hypothetical protein
VTKKARATENIYESNEETDYRNWLRSRTVDNPFFKLSRLLSPLKDFSESPRKESLRYTAQKSVEERASELLENPENETETKEVVFCVDTSSELMLLQPPPQSSLPIELSQLILHYSDSTHQNSDSLQVVYPTLAEASENFMSP